jgi:hypothetical protein
MTTTGERLVEISALTSGTAAALLLAAYGASGTIAGDLLASRSSLETATAIEHLADPGSAGIGSGGSIKIHWLRRGRRAS